jgi:hypothetical protein
VTEEKRNGRGTDNSEECSRGTHKKNEKEHAAGDQQIELHVSYVIGRAGGRRVRTSAGRRRL